MTTDTNDLVLDAWDDRALEDDAPPPPASSPAPLVGVGGLLLFFCLSIAVLSPTVNVAMLPWSVSRYSPLFGRFPGLLVTTSISTVLHVAVLGAGVYAGVALWRIRPHAVRTAKRVLLLAHQLLSPALVFFAGLGPRTNQALLLPALLSAVGGSLYPLVWFAYLTRSERVKATYRDELAPPV